jgi:hypothetical protein
LELPGRASKTNICAILVVKPSRSAWCADGLGANNDTLVAIFTPNACAQVLAANFPYWARRQALHGNWIKFRLTLAMWYPSSNLCQIVRHPSASGTPTVELSIAGIILVEISQAQQVIDVLFEKR